MVIFAVGKTPIGAVFWGSNHDHFTSRSPRFLRNETFHLWGEKKDVRTSGLKCSSSRFLRKETFHLCVAIEHVLDKDLSYTFAGQTD